MSIQSVRRMESSDIPQVYRIACSALDQCYARGLFGFLMFQWSRGQLVSCDMFGEVTGFICGTLLRDDLASISLFAVDAAHRREGAGTALLEAFAAACARQGCRLMQLEVRLENESTRGFYRRRGFTDTELLTDFYTDHGNAVRMIRSTDQPS